MNTIHLAQRSLRVAVVGSGPAGFFTAAELLKSNLPVHIDLFEKLYAPYGLVRYGISPDHQRAKKVVGQFEKTAAHPGFCFWGNVEIGKDLSIEELRLFYDAVVMATGAEFDRRLSIPGADLPGCHTSLEFAGWINGHPDFTHKHLDLSHETAVIIGNGNVALDVARILAKPVAELRETDIALPAFNVLAESRVRTIYIVGRRGPVQASFSYKELHEVTALPECAVEVEPDGFVLNASSREELREGSAIRKQRVFELLKEVVDQKPLAPREKKIIFLFLKSPKAIGGSYTVETIAIANNVLTGGPGAQTVQETGETITIPCGLIVKSIGHQGLPIPGLPFDEKKGVIVTSHGRIMKENAPCPGLYAAGWIHRGARGLVGNNKKDAHDTVRSILEDAPTLPACPHPDSQELSALLRAKKIRVVSHDDWRDIDAEERRRGQGQGIIRQKFLTREEVLAFLG